jgi:methylmalonyl-CoA decarboxylase
MSAVIQPMERTTHAMLKMTMDGPVATITLSQPAKRNALSHGMLTSLIDACRICEQQHIRAMILSAKPQAGTWSAGHDIAELPHDGSDPLGRGSALEMAMETLRQCGFPVIAQVQGSVWGGAVELVANCDIVVADDTASFALTPARIGLPYNLSGLRRLTERLSFGMVRRMMFSAAPLSAGEALRAGLVDDLAPVGEIEAHVTELARRIASNAPLAMACVKQQLRLLSDARSMPGEWFELASDMRRKAYQGRDYREGVLAFQQKRFPRFEEYPDAMAGGDAAPSIAEEP